MPVLGRTIGKEDPLSPPPRGAKREGGEMKEPLGEAYGGAVCPGGSLLLTAFASPDDNLSGLSSMEVDDRISYLEQRLQLQEDEIQVLKAALADVLRRLSTCEENGLNLSKRRPDKGIRAVEGLQIGPLQVPGRPEVRP